MSSKRHLREYQITWMQGHLLALHPFSCHFIRFIKISYIQIMGYRDRKTLIRNNKHACLDKIDQFLTDTMSNCHIYKNWKIHGCL